MTLPAAAKHTMVLPAAAKQKRADITSDEDSSDESDFKSDIEEEDQEIKINPECHMEIIESLSVGRVCSWEMVCHGVYYQAINPIFHRKNHKAILDSRNWTSGVP